MMVFFYLLLGRGREEAILARLPSLLQCPGEQKGLFQHAGTFLIHLKSRLDYLYARIAEKVHSRKLATQETQRRSQVLRKLI
jgi:hypothetical protein